MKHIKSNPTVDTSANRRSWVLVADQSGAKLFEKRNKELSILKNIPYPEGKVLSHNIDSDAPGRMNYVTGYSSSYSSEVDPHEQRAVVFAQHLAELLEEGRTTGKFEEMYLVAEPKFLGRIKGYLTNPLQEKLKGTFEKNYAKVPVNDLVKKVTALFELS